MEGLDGTYYKVDEANILKPGNQLVIRKGKNIWYFFSEVNLSEKDKDYIFNSLK